MIRGIIDTSFLDWDGKIVMVLYTARCNFRCPFCHNWELLEDPDRYPEKSWRSVSANLRKHRDFLDGVCITGGEPLLEPDIMGWLRKIKKLGLLAKLDTNGTCPEILERLFEEKLLDYVAMDVKGPLDKRYYKAAGVKADLEKIESSIDIIKSSGINYEFRTTVVPGIHTKKDILEIAKALRKPKKYVLQQFAPFHAWDEKLRDVKPYDNEVIEDMAEACSKHVGKMVVRGLK
jgi:pyruvate formate lyase activating enzyme